MKKIILFAAGILAVVTSYVGLTSQKAPNIDKFYYGFQEKILIKVIPEKCKLLQEARSKTSDCGLM